MQSFIIKVELLRINHSPKEVKVIIRKEFRSEYQRRESWGYDKFTRVHNLYQNGLVTDAQDELHLRVSIAVSSFHQGCKEIDELIAQRELTKIKNIQKIEMLRKKLENKKLAA